MNTMMKLPIGNQDMKWIDQPSKIQGFMFEAYTIIEIEIEYENECGQVISDMCWRNTIACPRLYFKSNDRPTINVLAVSRS